MQFGTPVLWSTIHAGSLMVVAVSGVSESLGRSSLSEADGSSPSVLHAGCCVTADCTQSVESGVEPTVAICVRMTGLAATLPACRPTNRPHRVETWAAARTNDVFSL